MSCGQALFEVPACLRCGGVDVPSLRTNLATLRRRTRARFRVDVSFGVKVTSLGDLSACLTNTDNYYSDSTRRRCRAWVKAYSARREAEI